MAKVESQDKEDAGEPYNTFDKHCIVAGDEVTILIDVELFSACVFLVNHPHLLDGFHRLHDKSIDGSEYDWGEDYETTDKAVLDGGGSRELTHFAGEGGDVLKNRVSENEVEEKGNPYAGFTSHDDLAESVFAQENSIVEVCKPKADTDEWDEDECELVAAGSHFVQLGVLLLVPLWGKEDIKDNTKSESSASSRLSTRRAKASLTADVRHVRPEPDWSRLRSHHLEVDLEEGGELDGYEVVPEAFTTYKGQHQER